MQTYWLDILRRIQTLTIIYQAQNPGNNTINICIMYIFENIHHMKTGSNGSGQEIFERMKVVKAIEIQDKKVPSTY